MLKKERYELGTLVQRSNGYVFLKTSEGMLAHHRWIAEQKILNRKLKEGECVIRRQPDRLDNTPGNLVVVQHSLTKFHNLPHARIIYVPRKAKRLALAA